VTRTALAAPDGPDDEDEFIRVTAPIGSGSFLREASRLCSGTVQLIRVENDACLHGNNINITFRRVLPAVKDEEDRLLVWQPARIRKRPWHARVSPQKLTGLAVFIAGPKRPDVGCEWRSHLSGETGAGLSADRQVCEAAGFVLAAIHYRLQDAADLAWRPVDTVLDSRTLSNLVVLIVTLATVMIFIRQGRLYELADNLGSVAVVWAAAFGLIHYGRNTAM
jgi:hypothetical protein